jgi:hypothetical protein
VQAPVVVLQVPGDLWQVLGGLEQVLSAPATHVPEALQASFTVQALLSALQPVPEAFGV